MKKLLFFAVLITGCSAKYTPTEDSVTVKRETKKMLSSKVDKMGGLKVDGRTYFFILNENNTFAAIVDMDDSKKYEFCAGTVHYNADTLSLNYYKNYKSKYLSDKVVMNYSSKEMVFVDADSTKNTTIKILNSL